MQDVVLSIALCHLSQGFPTHVGPPFFTVSHTSCSYDYILWEVMFDWSLSCNPDFLLTSRREAELAALTSHLSPPWARFSTGKLARVMVFGAYLPRVQASEGDPRPSNKHIAHLSAKKYKHCYVNHLRGFVDTVICLPSAHLVLFVWVWRVYIHDLVHTVPQLVSEDKMRCLFCSAET